MDQPWQSAWVEFRAVVYPAIEAHGAAIGKAVREGNPAAKEVVRLYAMLHRSFDPLTMELLKDALDDWRRSATTHQEK